MESSHSDDKQDFYQFMKYRNDQDLRKKLDAWEKFYNNDRPHGSHGGNTPYEVMKKQIEMIFHRQVKSGLAHLIKKDPFHLTPQTPPP